MRAMKNGVESLEQKLKWALEILRSDPVGHDLGECHGGIMKTNFHHHCHFLMNVSDDDDEHLRKH